MIRQCAPAVAVNGYYSAKIMAYHTAYGTGYDFCRFYSGESFTALHFNSGLTVSGIPRDNEEFGTFVRMISPCTIESELESLSGYDPCEITVFEGRVQGSHSDVHKISSVYEMSALVSEHLGADRDMWYTDMSHRIRHSTSSAYQCGGSFAAADMRYDGRIYISSVVSPVNERGRGNIRAIFAALSEDGISCVRAEPALYDFYTHIGLAAVQKQILLVRKT